MQNSYTVINASAGSGKTYILVQRLLMICLKNPNQHTAIQHILALTFTNKAANEMKERILDWLYQFTSQNYEQNAELIGLQKALKTEGVKVDIHDLHHRSKKLLDFILHHYSTLNIGTIDKFNARLVRSFSYELGLAKNFNLEIQSEPFLVEAVDQFFEKVGEDKEVTETLINYVNYKLQSEEKVNLNQTLYESARELIKDVHYEHLKRNENFDTKTYQKATKTLRDEMAKLQKESETLARSVLDFIKNKGLEISDFSGGKTQSIIKFFSSFINDDKTDLRGSLEDEEKKINTYLKGASAKSKDKEDFILSIIDDLLQKRMKIITNYIAIQKKKKILNALLPLKVNKDIQKELAMIEEENDLVLLSKFNILIQENLKNEPSGFIYEKIGTKIQHYFFDEFQDTSSLQWNNFLPLRDHSLSEDGTSFTLVGDPKQSIYRFRGGESQLMLDIINHKEETPKEAEVIALDSNWRSAKNIVEFNNQLYQYISGKLHEEHRDIFGKNAQQKVQSKVKGRVRVNLLDNEKEQVFFEEVIDRMHTDIQECLDNGFSFSDITLLTRKNAHSLLFAKGLNNLKVNYKGEETNIRTISEEGLTLELSDTLQALMQFLNWKYQPDNQQFLVMMLFYLRRLGRVKILNFTEEITEILALKSTAEMIDTIKEKYGVVLAPDNPTQLNLYNLVEYYVNEFSVEGKETDFLLNFLEILHNFTQQTNTTLKDFIQFWNDEARLQSIKASENLDAIQLMTIHKAKGLEFPIVFLPMQNTHNDNKFSDWFSTEEEIDLETVNLDYFAQNFAVYDEKINEFNEKNRYKNYIDRLCVQYVATTRPVEQMFLYLEKPTLKKGVYAESKIEIYDFVQQRNNADKDSFDFFELTEEDKKKQRHKEAKKYHKQSITSLHSNKNAHSSIQIATPSRNYQVRNAKVREGIFTHEILAQIRYPKDVEKVLEQYWLKGLINDEEKEQLAQRIANIINEYPNYFAENIEVMNEKDIMISDNGTTFLYRPDRLVKTDKGFIITDFKTGEEHQKYQKQMQQYQKALEDVGQKVLKTELIYV